MERLAFSSAATVARYLADKADTLAGLDKAGTAHQSSAARGILAGIDRLDLGEGHPLADWRDQVRSHALGLAYPSSTGF